MTAVIYARYSSDNQRGGRMTFNTIQHMLNNRRYIGELKYRDVLIPDAIPSIVSAELFNDVQEKILKNKKAPARRKAEDDYLLTTKLDISLKDQRQALVDTFINAIYLYDDKVLITFNYKEGTQTVTFGEATEVASEGKGSDLDCIPALSERQLSKRLSFLFYMVYAGSRPCSQNHRLSRWLEEALEGHPTDKAPFLVLVDPF